MDFYQIVVKGHLDKKRFTMFTEMEIEVLESGDTRFSGYLDQAALHSVLNFIRDLGIKLVLVERKNKGGLA